jgi:hypothetical protein
MITFMQLILIVVTTGLLVLMITWSVKGENAPQSVKQFTGYLVQLKPKFDIPGAMNPEAERREMEYLQNKIKGACHGDVISANHELQSLSENTCQQIRAVTDKNEVGNRSAWLKFRELAFSFNEAYFSKA